MPIAAHIASVVLAAVLETAGGARPSNCRTILQPPDAPETCITAGFDAADDRRFILRAHIKSPDGSFRAQAHALCLLSWHGKARVSHTDIPGLHQTFALVETEGNTGSGVLQIVLLGVACEPDQGS